MKSGAKTSTTCGPAKSACVVNWDADFAGLPPIELPDGRKLETLGECAAYILELPKKQQHEPQWQRVTALLLRAAEEGGGWPCSRARELRKRISGIGPPPKPRDKQAAWKAKRAARKR